MTVFHEKAVKMVSDLVSKLQGNDAVNMSSNTSNSIIVVRAKEIENELLPDYSLKVIILFAKKNFQIDSVSSPYKILDELYTEDFFARITDENTAVELVAFDKMKPIVNAYKETHNIFYVWDALW